MNHLFVSQDYAPDLGGMARRHVELARRFPEPMAVSTVAFPGSEEFDAGEKYPIYRQPFPFNRANRFANQIRWAKWLLKNRKKIEVIHCGNIRPVGYAVWWAHKRLRVPYLVYVNGGDLLRERIKGEKSALKRKTACLILGDAAGIVATSQWCAQLARDVMREVGITQPPPVGAFDLGTEPSQFNPSFDTGRLREKWGIGNSPLLLTIARLVPHKGQDLAIRAVAELKQDFPDLRYVMVGDGHDEQRLRALVKELNLEGSVIFAGAMRDNDLPEAYATATLYVGLSRIDNMINVEGFGISFIEAGASGVPSVAGDSGGVRSAVRDGETGLVVPPTNLPAIIAAIKSLLSDEDRRKAMGVAARRAVETHYNWDRVTKDTLRFTHECVYEGIAGA